MTVSLPTTKAARVLIRLPFGSPGVVVIRADGGEMIRMCWQLFKQY
jgi:hypothetical protein